MNMKNMLSEEKDQLNFNGIDGIMREVNTLCKKLDVLTKEVEKVHAYQSIISERLVLKNLVKEVEKIAAEITDDTKKL